MTAPSRDALPPVEALSPIDGRYRAATAPLRGLLSEAGLIRERQRQGRHGLRNTLIAATYCAFYRHNCMMQPSDERVQLVCWP